MEHFKVNIITITHGLVLQLAKVMHADVMRWYSLQFVCNDKIVVILIIVHSTIEW